MAPRRSVSACCSAVAISCGVAAKCSSSVGSHRAPESEGAENRGDPAERPRPANSAYRSGPGEHRCQRRDLGEDDQRLRPLRANELASMTPGE